MVIRYLLLRKRALQREWDLKLSAEKYVGMKWKKMLEWAEMTRAKVLSWRCTEYFLGNYLSSSHFFHIMGNIFKFVLHVINVLFCKILFNFFFNIFIINVIRVFWVWLFFKKSFFPLTFTQILIWNRFLLTNITHEKWRFNEDK